MAPLAPLLRRMSCVPLVLSAEEMRAELGNDFVLLRKRQGGQALPQLAQECFTLICQASALYH